MRYGKVVAVLTIMALVVSVPLVELEAARRGEESKIGVFDMSRIIRESKAGKAARSKFEQELKEKRDVLAKAERELREFQETAGAKKDMAAEEVLETRKEFGKEVKELQRLRADLEEEMKGMDQELTIKLLKDVVEVVQDIGKKDGYSVILQKAPNMVYVDDTVDITDEVIKRYNRK